MVPSIVRHLLIEDVLFLEAAVLIKPAGLQRLLRQVEAEDPFRPEPQWSVLHVQTSLVSVRLRKTLYINVVRRTHSLLLSEYGTGGRMPHGSHPHRRHSMTGWNDFFHRGTTTMVSITKAALPCHRLPTSVNVRIASSSQAMDILLFQFTIPLRFDLITNNKITK